jgi:hypothetical protein
MVNDVFGRHSCIKEADIQYIKDTCILLRDIWDLKEKANGDRDRQIAEARERLRAIDDITGDITEDVDSLRKILLDTRDFVLHSHKEREEFFRKWEARAWKIIGTVSAGVIVSILCDILK